MCYNVRIIYISARYSHFVNTLCIIINNYCCNAQGEVSRRDVLLDGLAGDLQLLAADIMTIIPLIHISRL